MKTAGRWLDWDIDLTRSRGLTVIAALHEARGRYVGFEVRPRFEVGYEVYQWNGFHAVLEMGPVTVTWGW